MFADRFNVVLVCLISAILLVMCSGKTIIISEDTNELVRLAVVEVDSLQISLTMNT